MLAVFFVTKTMMLSKSGLPQPADFGLMGLALFLIRPDSIGWAVSRHPFMVGIVLWIFTVNLTWAAMRSETIYLVFSSYYFFNALAFVMFAQARNRDQVQMDRALRLAVFVAAVVQITALTIDPTFRSQGTFNNPNQLAYFAVCALTVWAICSPQSRSWKDLIVIGLLTWIELRSLSRAGVIAFAVLAAMLFFDAIQDRRLRPRLLVGAVVGAVVLAALPSTRTYLYELEVVSHFERRMTKDSAYDEVATRNASRIMDYVEYAVFGAGEGDLDRFEYQDRIEIHSTFGTVFFSYGPIGMVLFCTFLWHIARPLSFARYRYLIPLLLYSLTHNGLRFTYFWIILALLASIGETERASTARAPKRRPVLPSVRAALPARSALDA